MHSLRHKKLMSKQGATRGGSNQAGLSDDGVQSNKSKNGADGSKSNKVNTRSKGTHAGSSERGSADNGESRVNTRGKVAHAKSLQKSIVDGGKSNRVNTRSNGAHAGSIERSSADGGNSRMVGADGGCTERSSADGVNSRMVGADGGRTERTNTDGVNSRMVGADGEQSERSSANGINSRRVASDGDNSQLDGGSDGGYSQLNIGSKRVRGDAPKRGRAKMSRTELKMAPRSGRVEIAPKGDRQFKYVGYNPRGLKYPSQVGTILKREYPGIIKVYNDNGDVVKQHPALSWNDYYWKKNRDGICYAKRVKQEFWRLFMVQPRHRAEADKILEAYFVRRVSNMVYQLRLEAVKMYFHKRKENCDDTRARTIELTEEQYLTCRLEWCSKSAWAWFSNYWTTDEYKTKRLRAQKSCMSSEDNAQNRGGSRNFTETQQFLEHTFGPEKSGTLNTYAVMKSGFKSVDKTGRSGPIPSQKAQRRLDDYRALVSDENSQELDGKALYTMGRGMKHGRVPIGDGAVDKATVLVHGKSMPYKPINPDDYERVVKENEQLKETNEINFEENSVNRALIMSMYADFGKEPPAELLRRLENIDARRQQTTGSPHGGSQSVDDCRRNRSTNDESDEDGNDDANPILERDDVDEEAMEGDDVDEEPMDGDWS